MLEKNAPEDSLADTWRLPLILTGFLIVALLLIYFPTTASIVHIWNSSETFTHGYLIFPISLWLVWRNKSHFCHIQPVVNYYAIPLILLASFAWLIAYYVDVQVIQQLALVSMIPLIVFCVLGWQTVKAAAFPLFFLIFAVPMGEGLVPYLVEFTADFTVALVQLTGIPIYREGTFFQLPTGNWSVVEACSGVRYLIASVTLGFLYAYLTYQSTYRRILFVLASIIVPIIANGLRAFMIVMIGHFSDMQLATGVDHLVYGWVFFGIVIAIMFFIGSFWREDEKPASVVSDVDGNRIVVGVKSKQFVLVSVALLLSVTLLPIKAYTNNVEVDGGHIVVQTPISDQWKQTDQLLSDWEPHYNKMDASIVRNYILDGASVDLFIGYYIAQREGAQLVTSANVLTEEKDQWQNVGASSIDLELREGRASVPLAHLKDGNKEILVAYFYYLDGQIITNDYVAKLTEAKTHFFGDDQSASIIAVSSAFNENREQTISNLQAFIHDMEKSIFQSIHEAGRP